MVDHLHGLGIQRSVWRVVKKYGFMMFYDVKMMAFPDRSPSSKHTVQQTLRKSMGSRSEMIHQLVSSMGSKSSLLKTRVVVLMNGQTHKLMTVHHSTSQISEVCLIT